MKKITIYFILLLLLGSSAVFAQATKSATTEKSLAASPPDDPKLSPEEKALLLTAGEDNPAKIDEASMVDPKMDPRELATEDDFGPSNAKPAGGDASDPRLKDEQAQKQKKVAPLPVTNQVSGSDQPVGEKNGTITNYRNISGPNDQPISDKTHDITNFRDMQGANDQPPGDSPNK